MVLCPAERNRQRMGNRGIVGSLFAGLVIEQFHSRVYQKPPESIRITPLLQVFGLEEVINRLYKIKNTESTFCPPSFFLSLMACFG